MTAVTITTTTLEYNICCNVVFRRVPLLFRKDTKHLVKLFESLKKVSLWEMDERRETE